MAATWFSFLKNKFAATKTEEARPPLDVLPSNRNEEDALTRVEFEEAIKRMASGKAVGPNGVPIEAYKYCSTLREKLFELLCRIWEEEVVPMSFASAKFIMLYKNKGSTNDPKKYRCIGLLNHEYKVLSCILLNRMLGASEDFLQDWQAGFRQQRGCRDNSMILRTLCNKTLKLGESIAITFIDYSAAFDSVSHRFIDVALQEAGMTVKIRAMFRAIYKAASAYTTIPTADGKQVKSDSFDIARGVVQGDITSPLYFILALELILRRHDNIPGKGVPLAGTILHTLGYADDAALIDCGDTEGIRRASQRVTNIAKGSLTDADMCISIEKTKALHVCKQDATSGTSSEEARKKCKFTCPHHLCGHQFLTKHGMMVHADKCQHRDVYQMETIIDHKHSP